jgi:magnesium-transporting ATPase (P-type)
MQKPWHSFSIEKTFQELKTSSKGLSQSEIEKRLKKFGLNKLPQDRFPD